MSFPLIPLHEVLSYLAEFNYHWSQALVIIAVVMAIFCFLYNAGSGYDRGIALVGFWALIVAIVIWIVGIAYPLILIASILVIYLLVYWIIWRVFIKNIIVVFTPDKPKDPKAKE